MSKSHPFLCLQTTVTEQSSLLATISASTRLERAHLYQHIAIVESPLTLSAAHFVLSHIHHIEFANQSRTSSDRKAGTGISSVT